MTSLKSGISSVRSVVAPAKAVPFPLIRNIDGTYRQMKMMERYGAQVAGFREAFRSKDAMPRSPETWVPAFAGATLLVVVAMMGLSSQSHAAYSAIQTPEDAILAKGFAAFMDGRDKLALSYFEEAVRLNPKNTAAQKGLTKTKIRLKKLADEEKQKLLILAKAKYREGHQMMKTDDVVGAIDAYHASVDADPDFTASKNALADIRRRMTKLSQKRELNPSQWAFSRGTVAYLDRDWAKAWRIWSERSTIEPTNVRLANATARAENNFRQMMLTEQEDFFRRGARALYEQGLYLQAKDSWTKVLALRSDDQEALEGKARSEEAWLRAEGKGRDNEAKDLLERGLDAYANRNLRQALDHFEQLARLDPDMTTATEYIAMIKQQMKDTQYTPAPNANVDWKKPRESNETAEPVVVPNKLKNIPEKITEIKSRINRDPNDVRLKKELDDANRQQDEESERIYKDGLIAYSQGNRALAIQQWKQVLVINPDHKKAAAALRKAMAEDERSDKSETTQ